MSAARWCEGTDRSTSRRLAAIGACALALALPCAALADEHVATAGAAQAPPATVQPATTAPVAPPHVSFDFLTAPAAPPKPQPEHTGIMGLAERVQITVQRLSDSHAQQHWGYAHGQVMFSFKTGGR